MVGMRIGEFFSGGAEKWPSGVTESCYYRPPASP
jgi:hypothetical protein